LKFLLEVLLAIDMQTVIFSSSFEKTSII